MKKPKNQVKCDLKFPSEMWAVFNLHVNDAGRRALTVVRARYPEAEDAEAGVPELERMVKDGVMEIFQHKPTPATQLFASACFIFTNGLDQVED
jgi:hypothetical protein